MTAPIMHVEPGQHLQRLRRVSRVYTDTHGRRFYAEADAVNQRPIGELVCLDGQLPWQPPMRFIKWGPEGSMTFSWDYQTMADELVAMTADYYDKATEIALQHNIDVPEIGGDIDRKIRAVLGAPTLSPEVPLQAEAEDPWLLGRLGVPMNKKVFSLIQQGLRTSGSEAMQTIKARVAKDLETRMQEQRANAPQAEAPLSTSKSAYNAFVAEGRQRGMSMADIAMAWNQHKTNLAEADAAAREAVA